MCVVCYIMLFLPLYPCADALQRVMMGSVTFLWSVSLSVGFSLSLSRIPFVRVDVFVDVFPCPCGGGNSPPGCQRVWVDPYGCLLLFCVLASFRMRLTKSLLMMRNPVAGRWMFGFTMFIMLSLIVSDIICVALCFQSVFIPGTCNGDVGVSTRLVNSLTLQTAIPSCYFLPSLMCFGVSSYTHFFLSHSCCGPKSFSCWYPARLCSSCCGSRIPALARIGLLLFL